MALRQPSDRLMAKREMLVTISRSAAGRATQGVPLLNLEPDHQIAAAVVTPKEVNGNGKDDDQATLLQ